jgi:two-component sensor histidine kinase
MSRKAFDPEEGRFVRYRVSKTNGEANASSRPNCRGELAALVRGHDWSKSPLGPIDLWPSILAIPVETVLRAGMPMALAWGPDGVMLYNDAWRPLLGDRHPAALGDQAEDVLEAIWPGTGALLQQVRSHGEAITEKGLSLDGHPSGTPGKAWFDLTLNPLPAADAAISGVLLIATECSARIRLQELRLRARNTLAVIRSIITRSADSCQTAEDYASHLVGRLDAIARVQATAVIDGASGIDLATLAADEMLACAAHEGEQVTIDGPPLRLRFQAAETLALALHELATNAVKFGALGTPEGHIWITWQRRRDNGFDRLALEWREETGTVLEPGAGWDGFGTEVLEKTLPYQLDATVERMVEASRLRWRIDLPLDDRTAI